MQVKICDECHNAIFIEGHKDSCYHVDCDEDDAAVHGCGNTSE